jgi:hypothetical protein
MFVTAGGLLVIQSVFAAVTRLIVLVMFANMDGRESPPVICSAASQSMAIALTY